MALETLTVADDLEQGFTPTGGVQFTTQVYANQCAAAAGGAADGSAGSSRRRGLLSRGLLDAHEAAAEELAEEALALAAVIGGNPTADQKAGPPTQYLKLRSPILEKLDGRIAILYRCMANLTVYLLKVSNSRRIDRHLRYPGKLRSHTSSLFSSTAGYLPLKPLAAIPTYLEDAQVKLRRGNSVTALSEG